MTPMEKHPTNITALLTFMPNYFSRKRTLVKKSRLAAKLPDLIGLIPLVEALDRPRGVVEVRGCTNKTETML